MNIARRQVCHGYVRSWRQCDSRRWSEARGLNMS
jgi:hypothetical protein